MIVGSGGVSMTKLCWLSQTRLFFHDRTAMLEQESLEEDHGVLSDVLQHIQGLDAVVSEQNLEDSRT